MVQDIGFASGLRLIEPDPVNAAGQKSLFEPTHEIVDWVGLVIS